MSVEQMAEVWKLELAPNKRLVLLAYADHADEDGNNVFPSLARIAHKTGYSRDQVRRISRELKDDNLMVLVNGATSTKPAEYKLTLWRGSKLPPLKPRRGVAHDPSRVGAPMPPEPSVEPSVNTPTGKAAPSREKKTWGNSSTGERQSYLIAYLHQRLDERDLETPSPGYKERLSGELRTYLGKGRSKADLLFALDHIVARWSDKRLEFWQAMGDVEAQAQRRHLRVVESEAQRPKKKVIS
jgi:hypothetical protein